LPGYAGPVCPSQWHGYAVAGCNSRQGIGRVPL